MELTNITMKNTKMKRDRLWVYPQRYGVHEYGVNCETALRSLPLEKDESDIGRERESIIENLMVGVL